MSRGSFRTNEQTQGTQILKKVAQIVNVKEDKDVDGKPRFRAQVRVYGDQKDQRTIPDKNLQWIRVSQDPSNKGGTPYLKPGMIVEINDFGGSPGGLGMGPYISSVLNYSPLNPENGESLKVASNTAEPRTTDDTYPFDKYKKSKDPVKNTETNDSIAADSDKQITDEEPQKKAFRKKDRYEGTKPKDPSTNTIGALKYPGKDPKDSQKVVKALQNNGEFIPQAVPMIQTLKKVRNGMNPIMQDSVGVQNLMAAIQQVMSLLSFAKKSGGSKEESKGGGVDCSLQNRENLTEEERKYCEYLDSLKDGADESASEDVEFDTWSPEIVDGPTTNEPDPVAYALALDDIVATLSANTQFLALVANAVINAANTP